MAARPGRAGVGGPHGSPSVSPSSGVEGRRDKASVRRLRWAKVKECVHLTLEDLHTMKKHLICAAAALLMAAPFAAHAQNKPIDFKPGNPFSDGFVAGNTLYVAGQQGPDDT